MQFLLFIFLFFLFYNCLSAAHQELAEIHRLIAELQQAIGQRIGHQALYSIRSISPDLARTQCIDTSDRLGFQRRCTFLDSNGLEYHFKQANQAERYCFFSRNGKAKCEIQPIPPEMFEQGEVRKYKLKYLEELEAEAAELEG